MKYASSKLALNNRGFEELGKMPLKPNVFITPLIALGFASSCAELSSADGATVAPSFSCPALPQDLEKYRQDLAENLRASKSIDGVRKSLGDCFGKPGRNVPACLEDIAKAAAVFGPMDPEVEKIGKNLKLPDIFYKDGEPTVPSNIEEIAKQNKWNILAFKTRGLGGFDKGSSSLQIVEIPGSTLKPSQETDWFVQWTLKSDDPGAVVNVTPSYHSSSGGPFAAIAMRPTGDGHYSPYFYLNRDGNKQMQLQNSMADCVFCHQNGLREISPRGTHQRDEGQRMSDSDIRMTATINRSMRKYGENNGIDWGYTDKNIPSRRFDPSNLAEPYGSVSDGSFLHRFSESVVNSRETRNEDFIVGSKERPGCAFDQRTLRFRDEIKRPENDREFVMGSPPKIRWSKVANAMSSCIGCHDGSQRSTLNFINTNQTTLISKILMDKTMPATHRYPLSSDERIALVNCLQAEGKAVQIKWLESLVERKNCGSSLPSCSSSTLRSLDENVHGLMSYLPF